MKVLFDTSIIVEIDRKNKSAIDIVKSLIDKDADLFISTVTLSEILTGCHLRDNYENASMEAKRILSQFLWMDFDSQIAEKTAEFMAFLIKKGKTIEYQDVAIAATFDSINGDFLLTLNKPNFENIASLKGRVFTLNELKGKLNL